MEEKFEDFLQRCVATFEGDFSSAETWQRAVKLFEQFGPAWLSYGVVSRDGKRLIAYTSNLEDDFVEYYTSNDLARYDYLAKNTVFSTDSVFSVIGKPIENDLYALDKPKLDAAQQKFGITASISQPFRDRGQCSALSIFLRSMDIFDAFPEDEVVRRFRVAASFFRSAYDFVSDPASYSDTVNFRRYGVLSQREREALSFLANGLQTEQIANQMGIKAVTVKKHFVSARQKLEARSREQAMASAIRNGLIQPGSVKVSI